MLSDSHFYFNKAADVLDLPDKIRDILLSPRRSIKVNIVVESEKDELLYFTGYRVQHNNARGPNLPELRYSACSRRARHARQCRATPFCCWRSDLVSHFLCHQ